MNPIDQLKSLSILFLHTLSPYRIQPARITDHTATLIDKIFFNSIEYETISGNIISDITDHLPNFLIIKNF